MSRPTLTEEYSKTCHFQFYWRITIIPKILFSAAVNYACMVKSTVSNTNSTTD
ncbi:MAG: hypothetical protein HC767_01750 [Akkermansiaceae bacterium]|nr:hypothetical protein [Akkermansiaceae bacterium]